MKQNEVLVEEAHFDLTTFQLHDRYQEQNVNIMNIMILHMELVL